MSKNLQRRTTLNLESLDSRELPSISMSGSIVNVYGSSYDHDVVKVTQVGSTVTIKQTGNPIVGFNITDFRDQKSYSVSAISQIRFFGYDGNDRFVNESARYVRCYLDGGTGNDYLETYDGNDTIYGGTGNDTIYGYGGNDYISGQSGNDKVFAGSGNDTVWGGSGHDSLYGAQGNDYLYGESGNDYLYGEDGNDYLHGGSRYDTTNYSRGGNGADTFVEIWYNEILDFNSSSGDRRFYFN